MITKDFLVITWKLEELLFLESTVRIIMSVFFLLDFLFTKLLLVIGKLVHINRILSKSPKFSYSTQKRRLNFLSTDFELNVLNDDGGCRIFT